MDVYESARQLAKSLKETEEYLDYMALREAAFEEPADAALLNEYKRLTFRLQSRMASGEELPHEETQRLERIAGILQLNKTTGDYLLAELRFQKLLADVFGILSEATGIDPEAFSG